MKEKCRQEMDDLRRRQEEQVLAAIKENEESELNVLRLKKERAERVRREFQEKEEKLVKEVETKEAELKQEFEAALLQLGILKSQRHEDLMRELTLAEKQLENENVVID